MAIKKSQLYTKLWQACDELRGGMDASQYKDYVLVILFIKYISDRAKNGDADLYIDLPKGCAFDDLVALKGKPDIGERMNVILSRIGEANEQLADTITNADFADEQKLGKGKDLVETVSNLIGVFQDKDLDLSNNRAADDDLIGDAYEYLMKNFATQSGKSKGQFYTPGEVSRVMARVINIAEDKRPMISIYDMTCGSGSLLIRAAAESERKMDSIAIEGQEIDLATIGMAKMSMVIHGIDDAELKHGEAHLKGGIPEADAAAYPEAFFKRLRKGYVCTRGEGIAELLEDDPVTTKAGNAYLTAIETWIGYFVDQGRDYLKQGDNPKELIRAWGDMLMHEVQELKGSPVDGYASYEHLMNYWAETMQDDCYLISRDGWKVELLPPAKKNASWEDYVCDLLPVQVVVNESHINERDKISSLKVALEENAAALAEIDERLEEENPKEDVDEEALAEERKEFDKKAKALRRQIKAANDDLVQKLVKDYATMTEPAIRHYVVETKWAEALRARFQGELARAKAQIVTDVKSLADRYAETLPDAEAKVRELENKVVGHLAAMGVEV